MAIIKAKSGTLTLGASGQSVVLASGASMSGQNYPAFEAILSSDQTLSDNVHTKIQFDTKTFDTNNAYDNTTNYRFTIPSGQDGKYVFYSNVRCSDTNGDIITLTTRLQRNGNTETWDFMQIDTGSFDIFNSSLFRILDASAGDYFEILCRINSGTPGTLTAVGDSSQLPTRFGGYRIGD